MTARPERPHVWLPGTGQPLLLHGTGGDEHDLLPLREHLAPAAPVLSVRGAVSENGMPRFFRRLREGVFDEDDLRTRTDELAGFLAETAYGAEVTPAARRRARHRPAWAAADRLLALDTARGRDGLSGPARHRRQPVPPGRALS